MQANRNKIWAGYSDPVNLSREGIVLKLKQAQGRRRIEVERRRHVVERQGMDRTFSRCR